MCKHGILRTYDDVYCMLYIILGTSCKTSAPLNISLLIFPIDIIRPMNRWDRQLRLFRHGPGGVE
jgi:hypothetical protein